MTCRLADIVGSIFGCQSFRKKRPRSRRTPEGLATVKDSQKGIVLGKGGSRLKAIGEAARKELAELLGVKVHLFLHVKVDERWTEDKEIYEELGLDWVR